MGRGSAWGVSRADGIRRLEKADGDDITGFCDLKRIGIAARGETPSTFC
jgi:hypothetical protein